MIALSREIFMIYITKCSNCNTDAATQRSEKEKKKTKRKKLRENVCGERQMTQHPGIAYQCLYAAKAVADGRRQQKALCLRKPK